MSNLSYSHHIFYMKEINGFRSFKIHLQTENEDKDGLVTIVFDGQIYRKGDCTVRYAKKASL